MANLAKPSKPSINGTTLSVNPVDGAVEYRLYVIGYVDSDEQIDSTVIENLNAQLESIVYGNQTPMTRRR